MPLASTTNQPPNPQQTPRPKPPHPAPVSRSSHRRATPPTIQSLLITGLVLLALGAILALQPHAKLRPAVAVVKASPPTPSPAPTPATYQWQGAAADPQRLVIPSLGINAYIQTVGLDASGQIGVPSTIHLTAWYTRSVRPGDTGLSIIDGHVDGPAGLGIFADLAKLQRGDTFTVIRGDGHQLHYQVAATQTIPVAQVPPILFSQDPKVASQLNLITCGGTFNDATGQYNDRTIVSATLATNPPH